MEEVLLQVLEENDFEYQDFKNHMFSISVNV